MIISDMSTSPENEISASETFSDIDLHRLEHESDRYLALGFLIAVVFHGLLFAFVKFEHRTVEVKIPEQMEVRLVIRPPRLTRPLIIARPELVPRQELRKQFMQHFPSGIPRYRPHQATPGDNSWARVPDDYDKVITPEEIRILVAQVIAEIDIRYKDTVLDSLNLDLYVDDIMEYLTVLEREPTEMISLNQSLLKIDDLDTGEYRALAIKDPGDKKNILGFVYMPAGMWVASSNLAENQTTLYPAQASENAIAGLAQGVTQRTGVDLKVDKQMTVNSPELLQYPIIYISSDQSFLLTPAERENLGLFVKSGGFVLVEPFSAEGLNSLTRMLSDAVQDTVLFETLDSENPILHCFYDFENPTTMVNGQEIEIEESRFNVTGIFLDDLLIGLLLDGRYGTAWADHQFENPYFRLAANAVVYSIIKEGSIAKQYINQDMYGKRSYSVKSITAGQNSP